MKSDPFQLSSGFRRMGRRGSSKLEDWTYHGIIVAARLKVGWWHVVKAAMAG
jgi:hypothetical protein